MRKASIDIGTNSTRLLVAEVSSKNELQPILLEQRMTRLGEGLPQTSFIQKSSINRVVSTLNEYRGILKNLSTDLKQVVSTSAVRDASNQQEFIKTVKEETGLTCRVLSGDEEASLTLLGVRGTFKDAPLLFVCDVGGGSTEFVADHNGEIVNQTSVDIGSRKLTEKFLHHNPVLELEMDRLRRHTVHLLINELATFPEEPWLCVATGGTATSLALMALHADLSDAHRAHGQALTADYLDEAIADLTKKPIEKRKSIAGLEPERADVILAGAVILRAIQAYWRVESLTISTWDLLHGLLLE